MKHGRNARCGTRKKLVSSKSKGLAEPASLHKGEKTL